MNDCLSPKLEERELLNISALALAHIGDAVFELMVRTWLISKGSTTAKSLHRETVKIVSATAQSKLVNKIMDKLSDDEISIYKRGRNAHTGAVPQSATYQEYHAATGLETLLGYVYLSGQSERLCEIFKLVVEIIKPDGGEKK